MPYKANASALLACVFISLLACEQALCLGKKIAREGYKPVKELSPGSSYRLCRNAQNPRDSSCIEVKDGTRVRGTLNKDFAHLLALGTLFLKN